MKSAMILCALATVCCFSTGSAVDNTGTPDNAGTAALTGLKTELETTTNDLRSYNKNLVPNTRSKLSDSIMIRFEIMYSITSSAIDAIRSEIDQAILAGKNAEPCFEPSKQRIRQASSKTQVVLNKCSIDALATVYPVEKNINALLQQGNRLTNELNAIAIKCKSSNATATENCIIAKIPKARSSIDAYRNKASSLKQNGDRTSLATRKSVQECYQPGIQTLRDVVNAIRSDAHQCVANAETIDKAGTATLMKLKSKVQAIMNDLSSYSEKLYYNTHAKLTDLLIVEIGVMNNIRNSTLNVIQLEIDQATAAGKNAKHCFKPSSERIDLAHVESLMVLYKCFNITVATADSLKNNIETVRQMGYRLISELNAIASNCISSNATTTEKCILAKIPEANVSFDAYLNTTDSATRNGDRSSLDAQVSALECYQPGVQTLRDVSNGARSDAHQCVANA